MTLNSSSRKNKKRIPNLTKKKSTTLSQMQNPHVKDGNLFSKFSMDLITISGNRALIHCRNFCKLKKNMAFSGSFLSIDVLCFGKNYCPPLPKGVYLSHVIFPKQ